MKKALFFLLFAATALLTGCSNDHPATQVIINDDAKVLSKANCEAMTKLFADCDDYNVFLYTVRDTLDYNAAKDANPRQQHKSKERRKNFFVVYHPNQKWIFLDVPEAYSTTFQSQYIIDAFHLQNEAASRSDVQNIEGSMSLVSDMLHNKPGSYRSMASSITGLIDFCSEWLILPSHRFFHRVFFRIPLLFSMWLINIFNSLIWAIVAVFVTMAVLSLCRRKTKGFVWLLLSLMHLITFLSFVCLFFLMIPSFETLLSIGDFGWTQTAGILEEYYNNTSAMSASWIAAVVFIVLYLIHTVIDWYLNAMDMNSQDKVTKTMAEQKNETAGQNASGIVGMFILAFFMPQSLLWAVSAYFLQNILCDDLFKLKAKKQVP